MATRNYSNAIMGAVLMGLSYYGLYVDQMKKAEGQTGERGLMSTDPATGIELSNEITISGTSLELLGIGVRTKVVVNVYSAGFYLPADVRKSLKAFEGKTASQLTKNAAFFKAIENHKGSKAVILAFARDVGVSKVAEALMAVPGAKQSVKDELGACITKNGDLKKGDQLMLNWPKKGVVKVKSKTTTFCTISDEPLASGLLAMYLGDRAVSGALKASMARRAEELLSA